jgi:hypothetical protein
MVKTCRFLVAAMVLTVVVVSGCSDRSTNYEPVEGPEGGILWKNHVAFDALMLQIRNDFQVIQVAMYLPYNSIPWIAGSEPRRIPMLILLPPQNGDPYYYFNHGLMQIADELIATGQIEPMAIACIGNDWVFGGYWFAGNYQPGGKYDDLIGGDMVGFLYDSCFIYGIDEPGQRGIGGIGQGAYGALRAAIKHPGTFTSISAVDGPLDFDGGEGHGRGLIDLMDSVFVEQSNLTSDSAFRNQFDSLSTHPISRFFIGGAVAFSPHDTLLDVSVYVPDDSLSYTITITGRHQMADSTSLIDHIVNPDARNLDFHMPFTYSERPYAPIWNMWLDNNLENMMAGSELQGTRLWIGTSPEAKWGFHNQTMSFIQTLHDRGYEPEVKVYNGYDGFPATGSQYVYELLKDMLIFHSNNFKAHRLSD